MLLPIVTSLQGVQIEILKVIKVAQFAYIVIADIQPF